MKLLLVFTLFLSAAHASREVPIDPAVWQSADDQSYDDLELNSEAFWYENGDVDNRELLQLVYQWVGPGSPAAQRRVMGQRGMGGMSPDQAGLNWQPCTKEMVSRDYHPGYILTPRGGYRNPNYIVRHPFGGSKMCARIGR